MLKYIRTALFFNYDFARKFLHCFLQDADGLPQASHPSFIRHLRWNKTIGAGFDKSSFNKIVEFSSCGNTTLYDCCAYRTASCPKDACVRTFIAQITNVAKWLRQRRFTEAIFSHDMLRLAFHAYLKIDFPKFHWHLEPFAPRNTDRHSPR